MDFEFISEISEVKTIVSGTGVPDRSPTKVLWAPQLKASVRLPNRVLIFSTKLGKGGRE